MVAGLIVLCALLVTAASLPGALVNLTRSGTRLCLAVDWRDRDGIVASGDEEAVRGSRDCGR